jgi:hypothetical protein
MRKYYGNGRKIRRVARMNYLQWTSWSGVILGLNRAKIEDQLWKAEIIGFGPEYCLLGRNCKTMVDSWVIEASIIARGFGN